MDAKVRELIEEPLKENNIKLCDVEYVKEGAMYFLRVVIDKEPFVLATGILNPLIDTLEDEFDDSYVLDVCSLEKGEN